MKQEKPVHRVDQNKNGALPLPQDSGVPDEEIKRLLQEVQVHQIGLEVENQGLRISNIKLEEQVHDGTEEAKEQARILRELGMALTRSAEAERKKLAQVLHDHLQQFLVAAKISADQILQRAKKGEVSESIAVLAQNIQDMLNESIDAARSLAVELYPPVLKDAGLFAALEWLSGSVGRQAGVTIRLHAEDTFNEFQEADIFLYEAAREFVLNAVKHAQTDSVDIFLKKLEGTAFITVQDSGRGFNCGKVSGSENLQVHFGLASLRERARLLGGGLKVESQPGKGTKIILSVPYAQHEGSLRRPFSREYLRQLRLRRNF